MSDQSQIPTDASRLWNSFREVVSLLPDERAAALARVQCEDPELYASLLRLLRYDEKAAEANFLDEPAKSVVSAFDLNTGVSGLVEDAPRPAQSKVITPRELGPYQLLEEIGRGGMGTVWKARQTRLNKIVAVKVLAESLTQDGSALARFNREMQAVGSLEHPNIVRALDADECQGTHYLVMEFVNGVDLSRTVKSRGPLPVNEACEYVRQAALGLAYAHSHGLVHRDIKPSNLLLAVDPALAAKDGTIGGGGDSARRDTSVLRPRTLKILDMGLARLQSSTESPLNEVTRFGQILGTPDYMAPEQWSDTHSVDARADLYSLGCTLFYLLIGRAPFQTAENNSIGRMILAHTLDEPPDLQKLRPDVPAAVAAVYSKLMAKRPVERYESAAALAEALVPHATVQFGAPLTSAAADPIKSDPSVVTIPMNTTTIQQSAAKEKLGRARMLMWSIWVAGCCAAIALVAFFLKDGVTRPDPELAAINYRVAASSGNSTASSAAPPAKLPDEMPESPPESSPSTAANTAEPSPPEKPVEVKPAPASTLPTVVETPPVTVPSRPPEPPQQIAMIPEPRPDRVELPEAVPAAQLLAMAPPPPKEKEPERKPAREIPWLKLKLVYCPAGTFRMGSPETDEEIAKSDEIPPVTVTLSEFWLGETEITQDQWRIHMGSPDLWRVPGTGALADRVKDGGDFPASSVTWDDAYEFCRKLTEKERREGRLPENLKYALPTEAQWEYACRAGSTTRYSFGDDSSKLWDYGWFGGISGRGNVRDDLYAHRVRELKPNAWGLYDMHGNVTEWCADAYLPALTPGDDPHVLGGADKVYRGGSWLSHAEDCRSSRRYYAPPLKRDSSNQFAFKNNPILGFRIGLVSAGRN